MSPRELFEHLHAAAFNEDVTYAELLHVALAFAVFWYFAFEIGKFVLGKWSYGKPWLKVAKRENSGGFEPRSLASVPTQTQDGYYLYRRGEKYYQRLAAAVRRQHMLQECS